MTALRWMAVLVALTAVLAEVLLRPADHGERLHLFAILAVPALVAAAALPVLRVWVSRRASVASAALTVGLCSLAVGAVATAAASNAMFVSGHDFRLFLVVLVLSCGIALAVGAHLTAPLAGDVARLGEVAEQVAEGDLTARTGIRRHDEVGRTARAVDRMVEALEAAERERITAAAARRMLFTSLGHDLRTPLAAMRAAVESLQDGVAPDPDRYLAIVGTQVDGVEALLDRLVELARLESGGDPGPTERVSVTELADEAVEALSPLTLRRGVRLVVVADGPAVVDARPDELGRVLRNLLDNAIRHSPDRAVVRVEVRARGDRVELAVHDEGPGFEAEFRSHAFDPFTRADPARRAPAGRAGLGLAITRAIVETHGGRCWIAEGPGGLVCVELPAARPPADVDVPVPT